MNRSSSVAISFAGSFASAFAMGPLRHLCAFTGLLLGLALTLASAGAAAQTLQGTVQRVVDGDSFWLQPSAGGKPVEVRLQGIDAPEGCQAHGPQSKAALQDLMQGQTLQVRSQGKDQHGRVLGTAFVAGRNLNAALVQEGQAWSSRFRWDHGPYVKEERQAQALRRGLHAEGGAIQPRDFRRQHGPCQSGEGVVKTLPGLPSTASSAGTTGNTGAAGSAGSAGRSGTANAVGAVPATAPARSAFRCDGRTHCSQMRSCEEAKFFLANCPGAKMDGNGDGVPCESQWCGR